MKVNPFEQYGVPAVLFQEIGAYLVDCTERLSVREGSVVGSQHDGAIAGVPLSWRNVKDGSNGYYWTLAISGSGWKLRCASSIAPPQTGEDYIGVMIQTSYGLRQRYIFRPDFAGDFDQMKKDLALVRMFID